MSESDVVMLLGLVEHGFNTGDLDALDDVLAPDVVVHSPLPVPPGAEGLKATFAEIRKGFPDAHATIDDLVYEGDRIYRRWTVRGTHNGEFAGIPPTGRRIEISGVDVERFHEGRIVEHWNFFDRLLLMEQLGVAPAPETTSR